MESKIYRQLNLPTVKLSDAESSKCIDSKIRHWNILQQNIDTIYYDYYDQDFLNVTLPVVESLFQCKKNNGSKFFRY